ncbi:hypothetical protein EDC94DRAFT_172603 [Helicostylum pulchrum]|nr:hypothetical protein EDC94DRAFT_172603 [Helicostylum pulchrum]
MDKENEIIDRSIEESRSKTEKLSQQLIAYSFEYDAREHVAKMKKKTLDQRQQSLNDHNNSHDVQIKKEMDNSFLDNSSTSVGSIIKYKACALRNSFHTLSISDKAIVTLGWNSIVHLGFDFPLLNQPFSTTFSGRH